MSCIIPIPDCRYFSLIFQFNLYFWCQEFRSRIESNLYLLIYHCTAGSNRVCGMDEFSVTISLVTKDKKDKEVLEVVEDLVVNVEDQQVRKRNRINKKLN